MNPSVASLLCICGIAGLFYLDRDSLVRISKALWLPVIYLWIIGSRPMSQWLGITPPAGTNVQLDGSPLDRVVYEFLLAASLVVLIRRGKRPIALLTANWLISIYFLYCLVSISWAYFPDVALKRWIKAISDIAMVLIILTDGQPVEALRRLISRVGFILLPTSVLLIKYYSGVGRLYSVDGDQVNVGVTTNKNSLGLLVLVISLGALWNVRSLVLHKEEPNRGRRILAQGALLAFGLALFGMANSATSIACFILGGGLILMTSVRAIRSRPARVHALCLIIVLLGGFTFLFGGDAGVVHALGRKTNFTGRTDIWEALLPAVSNPIAGAGFESFWISPDVEKMQRHLRLSGWYHPEDLNEAHNGYLEMYLNLGWIGVCLIALVLISGYRSAGKAFQLYPELGSLILAYIGTAVIYNLTEAGFREQCLSWIFLLLAMFSASSVTVGRLRGKKSKISASYCVTAARTDAINRLGPESETMYTGVAKWM
jgi:exopolysaccharide production protein ExoQ